MGYKMEKLSYLIIGLWLIGIFLCMNIPVRKLLRLGPSLKDRAQGKGHITKLINEKRRIRKVDRQMTEDMAFLRNLLLLGSGQEMGLEYVLSRLAAREGALKEAYMTMLNHLRLNRNIDALESFKAISSSSLAEEFAGLLIRWDELDGRLLAEIMESHQKTLKEIRLTEKSRRDESLSDLIYLPAVINVLIICVNFIYVSYYIRQVEIFSMLF